MKKISTLIIACLFAVFSYAQSNIPQLVNFSAVVRDIDNQPLINTPISIRLTFKEGGQNGPLVYCALHQTITNQNGFMSLLLNRDVLGIGCNGAPSTNFENILWENGGFWLEVEYQTLPGSPFVNLGQLELASSFYAFAAGTAERINDFDLSGANNGDVLTYNITTQKWEPLPPNVGPVFSGDYNDLNNLPDLSSINTDNQQISVSASGDTLYLQNGGFVIIPGISSANSPSQLATISTTNISEISVTMATSGGNITSSGGSNVTQRGVCWSLTQNPTTADNTTNDGTGVGSFISNLSGLTANTNYYVRAYAVNSAGTAYGNQQTFTTTNSGSGIISNPGAGVSYQEYTYNSVVLGNGQEWMSENLRTSNYANGDTIQIVSDANQWSSVTTGAYGYYNDDIQYENIYGKLYNWYAVTDSRNLCPPGWHVPTDLEWTDLTDYLGGLSVAGGKIKSTGIQNWLNPNTDATNESGFSGLPGGGYDIGGGGFYLIGGYGYWWSSTESSPVVSIFRSLSYNSGAVFKSNKDKRASISVRCLRD